MYLNARNTLGLAALAGATVLSWYWSREQPADPETNGNLDSLPLGYYLTDATILGTDEEGRVLYRIWAGRAEERPAEERLLLSEVRVEYQPVADVPWRLTARSGEAPLDRSYLDLSEAVELAGEPRDGGARIVIRTQRLRLEPETFVATTEGPVSLFIDARRLEAVGMRADLKDDRLELESDVHGQFLP